MKTITAKVISVHVGEQGKLSKQPCKTLQAELVGFKGDRHRSHSREAWAGGDKQPEGTVRRNERQWSAVSVDELADISTTMDLTELLTATTVGANLCLEGVDDLSKLPKGSILLFPSGAELMVEDFNPPCLEMGQKIAAMHATRSGKAIRETDFSKAAQYKRGVIGVIEVAGLINAGDEVIITIYQPPKWSLR